MFKRIVIGVKEHDGGRDAIELVRQLADPSAELTLVCVYASTASTWRGSNPIYESVLLQQAEDVLAHVRRDTPIEVTLRPIASTSPGRGLHTAAEEADADVLVVGSCRRGLLGRVLLGNDAKDAMGDAPCPVLIAPAGYARRSELIKRIGIGYDGSPESEHALAFARRLAGELQADLSALQAVEIPAYAFMVGAMPHAGDSIDDLVISAFSQVSRLPGVEPHAVYGHPAEELARYSESVDLLVVGCRGYGPIGRLVHGSTTSSLAGSSHCPLLVLTRAGDRSPRESGDAPAKAQSALIVDTVAPPEVRS